MYTKRPGAQGRCWFNVSSIAGDKHTTAYTTAYRENLLWQDVGFNHTIDGVFTLLS